MRDPELFVYSDPSHDTLDAGFLAERARPADEEGGKSSGITQ